MRWLERLRTLEEKSNMLEVGTAKTAESPSYSSCSAAPQECEVSRALRPADLPAEWNDGVAHLRAMGRPALVRPDRWRQVVADASSFLDLWGAQAAALAWTTLDVFGAHPTHPIERLDLAGLVILLHGDPVLALTADAARTRMRSGAVLTYYRRPRPGAVPLWELQPNSGVSR